MSTNPWRLRILLLLLAAAALTAAILWQPVDPRLEAYLHRTTPGKRQPAPATNATQAPAGPAERTPRIDSAALVARQLSSYGVVWNGNADSLGAFYALAMIDSAFTPEELGFVRAGALLDRALELEAVGTGGLVAHVRVANRAPADSALHEPQGEGCDVGVPVPLAGVPRDSSWSLALPRGAVELLPASAWITRDSAADAAEAVRLARLVPGDTQPIETAMPTPAQLFGRMPFETHVQHFASDGVEVLIVVTRRVRDVDVPGRARTERPHITEQRVVVAERAAGSGPFRSVWSRYAAYDEDERNSETPFLPLRLGRARLLTIVTTIEGSESYGNRFVSRVAPGTWREIATWIGGC